MTYINFTFKAMASDVNVQADINLADKDKIIAEITNIFQTYEHACSRFIPNNPLSEINTHLNKWVTAPTPLINVIKEAYNSYLKTNGSFDPRILQNLIDAGYSLSFDLKNPFTPTPTQTVLIRSVWRPEFTDTQILIGDTPIDLGGIAKGYTVYIAGEHLKQYSNNFMINAGGDITLEGQAPEEQPWRIGIENPFFNTSTPVAVIEATNTAIATSSHSKRNWKDTNNKPLHHIINPKTGKPSNSGIMSVTVIHPDTHIAETWTKTIYLQSNINDINNLIDQNNIAALWVMEDGKTFYSQQIKPYLIWLNGVQLQN